MVLMALGCAGIAVLALWAPRRPRLAQLALLVVALFVLTNKVYSPQYVLWLIPLAALARPKWRDFLIWQACEVVYFIGIWLYLAYTGSGDKHQGLPPEGYQLVILVHLLGTLYLCAMVVRDALLPRTRRRTPRRLRRPRVAGCWTGHPTSSSGARRPPVARLPAPATRRRGPSPSHCESRGRCPLGHRRTSGPPRAPASRCHVPVGPAPRPQGLAFAPSLPSLARLLLPQSTPPLAPSPGQRPRGAGV